MSSAALVIISFTLTVAAIIALLRIAPRLGLLDLPDHRKHHVGAIPIVGGLALYAMLLVVFISGAASSTAVTHLLIAATFITVIGAFDDRYQISALWRLLVQFFAALIMVYGADLRLEQLGLIGFDNEPLSLGPLASAITIFGIVSVINAMNFIDGLDGLAGGLALIAVIGLWIVFSMNGIAVPDLIPILVGGISGFMAFNARWFGRQKAVLFLGDAGSTLLGLLLAWLMIDHTQGQTIVMSPVAALWLLAVPLIDFLAIILRRITQGRSPFKPDREHAHHVIKQLGIDDKRTVILLHLAAMLCASIGIISQALLWPDSVMLYIFLTIFASAHIFINHSRKSSPILDVNGAHLIHGVYKQKRDKAA